MEVGLRGNHQETQWCGTSGVGEAGLILPTAAYQRGSTWLVDRPKPQCMRGALSLIFASLLSGKGHNGLGRCGNTTLLPNQSWSGYIKKIVHL